ncbi:hypothetical protein CSB20_12905, partial [bacterium DOLZORAL124_64_63]
MKRPGAMRNRHLFWGLPAVVLLAGLLGACTTAGGGAVGVQSQDGLDAKQRAQAERLYGQLQREASLHRDRKTLELAGNLLDYYPAFERNDEALSLAVEAADRLGDRPRARAFGDELLATRPTSPLVDKTLLRLSDLSLADADTFAAVTYLIRYHNRDPRRSTLGDGHPRSAPLIQRLSPEELEILARQEQERPLWSYLKFIQIRQYMDAGRFPEAEVAAAEVRAAGLQDQFAVSALDLVSGKGPADGNLPHRPTFGRVNMEQVGVLCPLTGRYAMLGNAFYDGALLAVEAANKELGRQFTPLVEDSGGDPVLAALASRRLASEDGCGALFGAMMSNPTAAVALVADIYGVPLVSPTATNDRIWELGDSVFQTNQTGVHEVRLLAQLATTVMLKHRFAILHENTPGGQRHAQVFKAEVEKFGGEVVSIETYNLADTDFRKAILAMKEERPEVIFTPATVDQMILLAPQLDFYKAGALVMGLSHWNSERLFDRTGAVLERAIFPNDLALFPTLWTGDFNAGWDGKKYPGEAKNLAFKSYQSMRLLLDTMHQSGATNRAQLQDALSRRLANRDILTKGPDSFASTVRVFRGDRAQPFPAGIFSEAWA